MTEYEKAIRNLMDQALYSSGMMLGASGDIEDAGKRGVLREQSKRLAEAVAAVMVAKLRFGEDMAER